MVDKIRQLIESPDFECSKLGFELYEATVQTRTMEDYMILKHRMICMDSAERKDILHSLARVYWSIPKEERLKKI